MRDARGSDACGRSRADTRAASRRRSARRRRNACARACRSRRPPSSCGASDGGRSAHRRCRRARGRRRRAPRIRASRCAPASWRTRSVCAEIVFATTSSPLVSLSSRWTMPARGTAASCGAWWSSAFCSVPARLPAPGCTTSPAGLSITISASSSCDDRERDRFGRGRCVERLRWRSHDDMLVAAHFLRRIGRDAVHCYAPGVDPGAQAAARVLRQCARRVPRRSGGPRRRRRGRRRGSARPHRHRPGPNPVAQRMAGRWWKTLERTR